MNVGDNDIEQRYFCDQVIRNAGDTSSMHLSSHTWYCFQDSINFSIMFIISVNFKNFSPQLKQNLISSIRNYI